MTSSVLITLIICITLVIISIASAVGKAYERKIINKQINDFDKTFNGFKNMETPEKDKDIWTKF